MSDLKTPASLGFKMPAEWEAHAGTQMHWPSNRETWPGERLHRVEKVYLDIVAALHIHEPIHLFVTDRKVRDRVLELFEERGISLQQIVFHTQPINDVWARDCGPIFVRKTAEADRDGKFAITDWDYNAWGGKYPPFDDDDRLPSYVASTFGLQRFVPGMVLEGGSVETNGEGLLMTTESVLLNPNRNPELSKNRIEQRLKDYLGVKKIIWLKGGLAGDDTDGHVDDIARFLNKGTILTMTMDDPNDVNYAMLEVNLELLKQSRDLHGNLFSIETLPLPKTKIEGTTVDGSEYVPASYANFYVANGVVLVPVYDARYDEQALELFRHYFPDRQIIGIPCADLVWGQGAIHCITQQWYGV